jgi:hypothetical protein
MDRALHPDPYWRFASANELAQGIERVLRANSRRLPRRAARRSATVAFVRLAQAA